MDLRYSCYKFLQSNTIPSALWALHKGNNLDIRFSEEITILSAEEINNYSLPNVIFTDAELMEDQRTVKLTMNTDQFDATTMGVFNIEDDSSPPNTIDWQVVWIESPVLSLQNNMRFSE